MTSDVPGSLVATFVQDCWVSRSLKKVRIAFSTFIYLFVCLGFFFLQGNRTFYPGQSLSFILTEDDCEIVSSWTNLDRPLAETSYRRTGVRSNCWLLTSTGGQNIFVYPQWHWKSRDNLLIIYETIHHLSLPKVTKLHQQRLNGVTSSWHRINFKEDEKLRRPSDPRLCLRLFVFCFPHASSSLTLNLNELLGEVGGILSP